MQKILLAIVLLFFSLNAHAGAWLQKEGDGELIQTFNYFKTKDSYNEDGQKLKNSNFTKKEYNPYVEYGLYEELTIGGALSVVSFVDKNSAMQDDNFKFASADIFLRTPIWDDGEYIVSIQPGMKVPIESEAALNPEGENPIPELKISAGKGFKLFSNYSFVDIGATHRWRSKKGLEDMLKLDATLGLKVHDDWLVLNQLFHEESLGMKVNDTTPGNYNLTKLQFSVAFEYEESLFFQAGMYKNIDGKNTAGGNGFIFSTWYKF